MLTKSLLIHNSHNDFSQGTFESTEIIPNENSIKLIFYNNKYAIKGSYISSIIHTVDFKNLILSWNATTPIGTYIEIYCRVLVKNNWSKWLNIATWCTYSDKFSGKSDTSDHIACVNADTLLVKGSKNRGTAFQYKINFITKNPNSSPSVRLISASLKIIDENLTNNKISFYNETEHKISTFEGILNVIKYSQMTKDPKIASVMCSATSSSMVLNYYGVKITPEEVAAGVYDSVYDGFGNWPFNTAFISTFGLESYIQYFDSIADIKKELFNNNPVIVSVRYRQPSVHKDLPIISNAPTSYTNGHIIVVTGFIRENGKEYVVVNDPAASNDENVSLKYLLSEFLEAWNNKVAYVVHKTTDAILQPHRIPATLYRTGNEKIIDYLVYSEYKLKVDNTEIDISQNSVSTIMFKNCTDLTFNKYCSIEDTSSCWVANKEISDWALDFMFICKNGMTYIASKRRE